MSANKSEQAITQLITNSGLPFKDFDILRPVAKVQRVSDLLCSAFEGGSNYWYDSLNIRKFPGGYTWDDVNEDGRLQPKGDYWHWSTILPLIEGGRTIFRIYEDAPWAIGKKPITCPVNYIEPKKNDAPAWCWLNRAAIERGLKVFSELAVGKGGHHYPDWLAENGDASTGDVFLQCCCFGEVIYG